MNKISIICFAVILLFLYGCSDAKVTSASGIPASPEVKEDFYSSGSTDDSYVELSKINDNIWVHTTYTNYNGSRTPSNGLVAVSSEGVVLVDTPWTNEQTEELLKLIQNVFSQDVKIAVITHAHEDRIGGIDTLLKSNVEVHSTSLTADTAEKAGYKRPQADLDTEPNILLGDLELETYYPGEGHTPDNIVVWFPQYKVLFGGCIIKSISSTDLGSTINSNIQQWPASVQNIKDKFQDAETIIPGHGQWGNPELIDHTLELLIKNDK